LIIIISSIELEAHAAVFGLEAVSVREITVQGFGFLSTLA
jgi:hypothetical protein